MIKKGVLSFTFITSLTFCTLASAKLDLLGLELFPYVGADIQGRYMGFKKGYGNNTLRRSAPQGNAYGGVRFNEYFGVEAGYEETVTRSRVATLTTGDVAAGTPINEMFSPTVFKSKIKIQGPHVDLLSFYPICELKERPIQLLGSIGVSFLKATSVRQTISAAGEPVFFTRTLIGRNQVPRIATGLQYLLGQHLGIRGTVGWMGTSRLIISANDNIAGIYLPEVKPKSTIFCGLGFLWAF